jgi:beta-glucanase (GH16 family)
MLNVKSLIAVSGLGVALMAGCGGGGGGGSSSPNPTPTTPPTTGQVFYDDFSGSSLDGARWGIYDSSQQLQRTRFGFTPEIKREEGITFARLRLDSFNPQYRGQFKGTEMFTRQRFSRGQGLEFTARLRGPNLPPGIIFAFFSIYDRFNGTPSDATYSKTEIDFEFLTAEQEQFNPRGQRKRLYLNLWNDWNIRNGYDGNDVDDTNPVTDKTYRVANHPGFDWANWHTYTVQWFPDRTIFYVDGTVERIEREVRPDEDMSIHLNMWTGNPDFNQAYSASLQPTSTSQPHYMDVDFVNVKRIGAGVTAQSAPAVEQPLPAGVKSYRNR